MLVKYVASVVEGFPYANTDTNFKLPVPTSQRMIEWVKKVFEYLVQDQEMVKKSFQVCGISSSNPHKVRNGVFFKQCMGKALHNLESDDANEIDHHPFELHDYCTIMKYVIKHYDYV